MCTDIWKDLNMRKGVSKQSNTEQEKAFLNESCIERQDEQTNWNYRQHSSLIQVQFLDLFFSNGTTHKSKKLLSWL